LGNVATVTEFVRVMNEAAHGLDAADPAAERAIDIGAEFLAELSDVT